MPTIIFIVSSVSKKSSNNLVFDEVSSFIEGEIFEWLRVFRLSDLRLGSSKWTLMCKG